MHRRRLTTTAPLRGRTTNQQPHNMNLTEIITKVLENPQSDLILTEDGFDWAPKSNNWSTEYLSLLDREGMLQATPTGEPDAEGLAEWVRDNVGEWLRAEVNATDDHDRERIAFLARLFTAI
jgi:hypothetical protein